MIRTQVQLTGEQLKSLRRLASATGKSTAELIRNGIDQYLSGQHAIQPEDRVARAISVIGKFASGASDGSAGHDKHLAEAFRR